jgi:beta-galactosidase
MAWQAVAHGAEAVLYWQWRSALGGQEQYHGTLVDPSGRPRPFYAEAQQIANEFAKVSGLLAGASIPARIAVLHDYDSRWSIQWQRHQREFDYVEHLKHYARPLVLYNLPFDVASADAALDGYKVVIAPALLLLDEQRVRRLQQFVEDGGHLVLTARCAMKDRYNALLPSRQPGPLAALAGVEVEEYYALEAPVAVQFDGLSGQARIWAERLSLLEASRAAVLARYGASNGWLDGQPAVTLNAYGKGLVYYVGAYLDEAAQQALTRRILDAAGEQVIETPAGVQWCSLASSTNENVAIVINHTRAAQAVELPGAAHEHLSERDVERVLELPAYGVAVLTGLG